MRVARIQIILFLVMLSLCCGRTTFATPVSYTDSTNFMNDLPSTASVLNFDVLTGGDIINDGDTLDGITFAYNFDGVKMMVSNFEDTTSPDNFLGTNDGDIFQGGDNFSLSFASSNAIGMYFITTDELEDVDITLAAGGGSVGLDATAYSTLSDGSYVFFLGIIDSVNTFTTASVTTSGPFFLYNVDDIVTSSPIPEPQTFVLFVSGLVALAGVGRKRRK